MFIAYLDSSGRPIFDDKENYVLASIITNEVNWQSIDNGVKQIKLKHFPTVSDSQVELHAKDMVNRDGIFKHLTWDKIYAIFDDVFNFIAHADTEISIHSVLIDKTKLRKDKDIEVWAHRLLFERINTFIHRQNEMLLEAGHFQEYGIMITDSEGEKKDQKLRSKLIGMLREGTHYSQLNWLIEDPLFTDSKWRNMSQLVDCVAYGIRKHHRINTPSLHTTHWEDYYKKIETKFDSVNGSYFGIGFKKFP
jgi:hypothetical protein